MSAAAPAPADDVTVRVDVVAVTHFFLILRHRLTGRQHTFRCDDESILLGSSPSGDCYELTLPRRVAIERGISDVL